MSSASSPTPKCNPGSSSCGLQSTTLYLFGFLAGVLLLSMLGIAVVTRSRFFTQRREQELQRQLRAARRARGEEEDTAATKRKPRIFDAHLGNTVSAAEAHAWATIVPFSLVYVSPLRLLTESQPPPPDLELPINTVRSFALTIYPTFLFAWRHIRQQRTFCEPPKPPPDLESRPSMETSPVNVRACVGYIIVMPTDTGHGHDEGEDIALPVVELGVAEMNMSPLVDGALAGGG